MSYEQIAPGRVGRQLRAAITRALVTAYAENAERYDPDIGDNPTTFGICVVHNLRHLVEEGVEDLESVEVLRPRNSFMLRLPQGRSLYFYKAPPGASRIEELRFDESELKLSISQENAAQLQLDLDGLLPDHTELEADELPAHAVVVHFGDAEAGLTHAVVGAPYRTATGACQWAWSEPFDLLDRDKLASTGEDLAGAPAGPVFGLKLRDQADEAGRQG
jgi:hypothetical protein